MFLVYPSCSQYVFAAWQCIELDDGTEWLRRDLSIDCHSTEHVTIELFAALFFVVYPAGIPSYFAYKLLWDHGAGLDELKRLELRGNAHKIMRDTERSHIESAEKTQGAEDHRKQAEAFIAEESRSELLLRADINAKAERNLTKRLQKMKKARERVSNTTSISTPAPAGTAPVAASVAGAPSCAETTEIEMCTQAPTATSAPAPAADDTNADRKVVASNVSERRPSQVEQMVARRESSNHAVAKLQMMMRVQAKENKVATLVKTMNQGVSSGEVSSAHTHTRTCLASCPLGHHASSSTRLFSLTDLLTDALRVPVSSRERARWA